MFFTHIKLLKMSSCAAFARRMDSLKGDFMKFQILISLLISYGCMVPMQDFKKGTEAYELANPAYLGELKTLEKTRVNVAVVDTGVDYNHPNIEPYLAKNTTNEGMGLDILGKDFYPYLSVINPEDLKPVKFPEDYLSHGTHVAGIALEGPYLERVTENPYLLSTETFRLIPIRAIPLGITPEEQATLEGKTNSQQMKIKMALTVTKFVDVLSKSIDFAGQESAQVVNMSIGVQTGAFSKSLITKFKNLFGKEVAPRFEKLENTFFTIAAGNEGADVDKVKIYPAYHSGKNTITVGSLKDDQTISYFSNFGQKVDIYALGSDVNSYIEKGKTKKMSGTSMAAPLVANLAASMKAVAKCLTPERIKNLILKTSVTRSLKIEIPKEKNPLIHTDPKVKERKVKILRYHDAMNEALKACPK